MGVLPSVFGFDFRIWESGEENMKRKNTKEIECFHKESMRNIENELRKSNIEVVEKVMGIATEEDLYKYRNNPEVIMNALVDSEYTGDIIATYFMRKRCGRFII